MVGRRKPVAKNYNPTLAATWSIGAGGFSTAREWQGYAVRLLFVSFDNRTALEAL